MRQRTEDGTALLGAIVVVAILGSVSAFLLQLESNKLRILRVEQDGLTQLGRAVSEQLHSRRTANNGDGCLNTIELLEGVPVYVCSRSAAVAAISTEQDDLSIPVRTMIAPVALPSWSEVESRCARDCSFLRRVEPNERDVVIDGAVSVVHSSQEIDLQKLTIIGNRSGTLVIMSPLNIRIEEIELVDKEAEVPGEPSGRVSSGMTAPVIRVAAYSGAGSAQLPPHVDCARIHGIEIERYGWRTRCGIIKEVTDETFIGTPFRPETEPNGPQ